MILPLKGAGWILKRIPRESGDDPVQSGVLARLLAYSPRERG